MANVRFNFEFDMATGFLSVDITPNTNTTEGHYAFELIDPTGTTIKTVDANFFITGTPAPLSDVNVTTDATVTWTYLLPVDVNSNTLYGKYQFRALYVQSGSYGDYDNNFNETFRSLTIAKRVGSIGTSVNYTTNVITATDTTSYTGLTVSSQTMKYTNLNTGATSTVSSNAITTPDIGNYLFNMTSTVYKSYSIDAVYGAAENQDIESVISNTAHYLNLGDNIKAAKVILDKYDELLCQYNRTMTAPELSRYLRLTSRLAIIGAGLHVPSANSAVIEALGELETLVV